MSSTYAVDPPKWMVTARGNKAHLYNEYRQRGWCGADLRSSVDALHEEHCKVCTNSIQRFAVLALEPVPEIITERVTVQVVRKAGSRPMVERIRTWLESGANQGIVVDLVAEQPAFTQAEIAQGWPADG